VPELPGRIDEDQGAKAFAGRRRNDGAAALAPRENKRTLVVFFSRASFDENAAFASREGAMLGCIGRELVIDQCEMLRGWSVDDDVTYLYVELTGKTGNFAFQNLDERRTFPPCLRQKVVRMRQRL
jgi:hypothetical protein